MTLLIILILAIGAVLLIWVLPAINKMEIEKAQGTFFPKLPTCVVCKKGVNPGHTGDHYISLHKEEISGKRMNWCHYGCFK